jgi:hypothetical protein
VSAVVAALLADKLPELEPAILLPNTLRIAPPNVMPADSDASHGLVAGALTGGTCAELPTDEQDSGWGAMKIGRSLATSAACSAEPTAMVDSEQPPQPLDSEAQRLPPTLRTEGGKKRSARISSNRDRGFRRPCSLRCYESDLDY